MSPRWSRSILAGFTVLALTGMAWQSAAEPWLIATNSLEVGPADVTLPEKVGVLLAGERRDLAFEVAGRLVSCAEPGSPVSAGQVLARLDATLEEAQLVQAKLRLKDAQSEYRRLRGLRDAQATSAQRLESAETALELRRAELAVAREQHARRRIVSALNGDVVETYLEPGEVATPGERIATVMNLDSLKIELGVPGFQIGRVLKDARVLLQIPALEGAAVEGKVLRVANATVDGGHLFEVEVGISNADRRLRPGMTVGAAIVTDTLPSVVRVPLEVVVDRGGKPVAFFVDGDVARAVPLELAVRVGSEILVPAEMPYRILVVRGQRDLSDGVPVRVDNSVLRTAAAR